MRPSGTSVTEPRLYVDALIVDRFPLTGSVGVLMVRSVAMSQSLYQI